MATSAFKSSTKRAPIGKASSPGDSGSTNRALRRSRSLSRFSRLLPESPGGDLGDAPAPRGRFVNTVRGSGFPEISLDDLAIEFFPLQDSLDEQGSSERSGPSRRDSEVRPPATATASSQRRGRSVSRQSSRTGDVKGGANNGSVAGRPAPDANSRRRRSVSVVRCQISDSESDLDPSQSSGNCSSKKSSSNGNRHVPLSQKPTDPNNRGLRKSHSQNDLLKMHDGYSSQSSAITDDETKDPHGGKNQNAKTIRAVYAQKKTEHPTGDNMNYGIYEAMCKELRSAVEEIKMAMGGKDSDLASGGYLQKNKSDALPAVSAIRKNYASKLEQSEKRKQNLLAELDIEDQRRRELSKIVKEFLPDSMCSVGVRKPSQARKRSNDRNRMSRRLTEEAEKYFEDFISNFEDTDLSSFDGERSDASSTLGVAAKPLDSPDEKLTHQSPTRANCLPVEMDGVILPWLQWETSNDGSSHPAKNKTQFPSIPNPLMRDAAQDDLSTHDPSSQSISSRGSWSPVIVESHHAKATGNGSSNNSSDKGSHQRSQFDMDKYIELQHEEELLFERWRQRRRISSGGLVLCSNALY